MHKIKIMAYVYRHIRLDKNEPFYIGIGSDSDGKCKRAYQKKSRRNEIWKKIVSKTKYKVQILFDGLTWDEACQKEVELIALYGRIDKNNGTLCNLTDGGEGTLGIILSDESRKKISDANKGENSYWYGRNHKESSIIKMREIQKGKKLSEETKKKIGEKSKGRVFSEESLKKRSESMKGKNTWMLGKKPNDATRKKLSEAKYKKIINTETGQVYNSLIEMCNILGLTYNVIGRKLRGDRKNNTPFRYL